MVERHLSVPHRFVCFTDDSAGIRCATKPLPAGLTGWWAKLALFRRGLFSGPVLYLDLDTVITGSLDFVADYTGAFAILRDFYRPDGYGSGVMLWNEEQPQVWDEWVIRPFYHPLGDQGWIEMWVQRADRLQGVFPGKFVSYKADCERGLPDGAAACCFHGWPKPHQVEDEWVHRHWLASRRVEIPEHVAELL